MIMTNAYGAKDLHTAFMHFNKNLAKLDKKRSKLLTMKFLTCYTNVVVKYKIDSKRKTLESNDHNHKAENS